MALKLFLLEKENLLLTFQLSAATEELEIIKGTLLFYNSYNIDWSKNVSLNF